MKKCTQYALFLLLMERELCKRKEVCIEFHDGIIEHKYEIINDLFREGYIDGYYPMKGRFFTCTLSDKTMALSLLHNPSNESTKEVAKSR